MRRGVGISGLQKKSDQKTTFRDTAQSMQSSQLAQMTSSLAQFRQALAMFAQQHRHDILTSPVFRLHFHRMCATLDIDPLASNKGFWAQALGIGDYYFDLGVRIRHISLHTRHHTGGLFSLDQLLHHLNTHTTTVTTVTIVTEEDVIRAIKTLKPLGSGYALLTIGNRRFLQSVPQELNRDSLIVLDLASTTDHAGYVDAFLVRQQFGWDLDRIQRVLDDLLKLGLCWLDSADSRPPRYYVTSLFDLS